MSDERIIYKGRRVPLVLSELARVTKERDEAQEQIRRLRKDLRSLFFALEARTEERDELAMHFVAAFDEFVSPSGRRMRELQGPRRSTVKVMRALRERLRKETSGE